MHQHLLRCDTLEAVGGMELEDCVFIQAFFAAFVAVPSVVLCRPHSLVSTHRFCTFFVRYCCPSPAPVDPRKPAEREIVPDPILFRVYDPSRATCSTSS